MKDLEKAIEDASIKISNQFYDPYEDCTKGLLEDVSLTSIKSLEAKEYWQQGMYTQEQLINFAIHCGTNFVSYQSQIDGKRIWFDPINVKYLTTEMLLKQYFNK